MEGGSFGALISAGETDVVLMIMNEEGANKLMKREFTLGGEGHQDILHGKVGSLTSGRQLIAALNTTSHSEE